MSFTLRVSGRIDYRPTDTTHFREYSGRVASLSSTGCTIQAMKRLDPGSTLERRLSVPRSAWPIRVTGATVTWSHWDEFTMEYVQVPVQNQEPLHHCLAQAQAPAAV
jgi:hypothetical protein